MCFSIGLLKNKQRMNGMLRCANSSPQDSACGAVATQQVDFGLCPPLRMSVAESNPVGRWRSHRILGGDIVSPNIFVFYISPIENSTFFASIESSP